MHGSAVGTTGMGVLERGGYFTNQRRPVSTYCYSFKVHVTPIQCVAMTLAQLSLTSSSITETGLYKLLGQHTCESVWVVLIFYNYRKNHSNQKKIRPYLTLILPHLSHSPSSHSVPHQPPLLPCLRTCTITYSVRLNRSQPTIYTIYNTTHHDFTIQSGVLAQTAPTR